MLGHRRHQWQRSPCRGVHTLAVHRAGFDPATPLMYGRILRHHMTVGRWKLWCQGLRTGVSFVGVLKFAANEPRLKILGDEVTVI
jgi:hypothetical protein